MLLPCCSPAEFGVQYSPKQTLGAPYARLASGVTRVYICAAATGARDSTR